MKSRQAPTRSTMGRRHGAAPFLLAAAFLVASASASSSEVTATATATSTTLESVTSTTTAKTIVLTGTTIPQLVAQAEPCVVLCYNAASLDSGCSSTDFKCVCGNPNSLVVKMGICIGNYCDDSVPFDGGNWIADICSIYNNNPSSTEVAAASSLMSSEIQAVVATATKNPVPSTVTLKSSATGTSTSSNSTAVVTSSAAGSQPPGSLAPLIMGLVGGAAAVAVMLL